MKTVKFYTLGCKVNQYDTQLIREQFVNSGFKELDNGSPADICVINTCTVTARADSDSLNIIRRVKRENPYSKIIVTGCLAQMDAGKIKAIKGISLVIKNSDKENIMRNIVPANKPAKSAKKGISYFEDRSRAFIKIQDGCSNFCSYCKVPLVRGSSRSRPIAEIIREAGDLAKNGFKEIVLCGICLGAYGEDLEPQANIVDVIGRLENIPGILRIRLSSIEPKYVTDKLIAKLASSQKLCRHLHIPLQSGDDSILKKMNRAYTAGDYAVLIERIKSSVSGIAITTDVMVGFPGESEDNFGNTVGLVKKILPLKVHIFAYSPREGTAAYSRFKQGLDPKIIKERSAYLRKISFECSLDYKRRFLNRIMPVLIESKTESGYWQGYTGNYIRVSFKSALKLQNTLIQVKLKKIIKDCVLVQRRGVILKKGGA